MISLSNLNRRRFLQFSIRGLMLAVTLASLPCAWLGRRLIAARNQADAVRALTAQGVSIGYRHEWDYVNDRFSGANPPGPVILHGLLGEHFFLVPSTFIVDEFKGEKDSLIALTGLPTLTAGGIVNSPMGDEIIPILTQLTHLEDLSLYGTKVTDQGILALVGLPRLKNLVVSKTFVTERGVREFSRLRPDCVVHLDNDETDD